MLKGLSGGATAGQLPGVATGTTIGAGFVGEYVFNATTSGSPLTLATTVYQNIGSSALALTAGNWLVEMQVSFVLAAATPTLLQIGISQTTITLPPVDGTGIMDNGAGPIGQNMLNLIAATGTHTITVPPLRIFPAGGVNLYGVVGAT